MQYTPHICDNHTNWRTESTVQLTCDCEMLPVALKVPVTHSKHTHDNHTKWKAKGAVELTCDCDMRPVALKVHAMHSTHSQRSYKLKDGEHSRAHLWLRHVASGVEGARHALHHIHKDLVPPTLAVRSVLAPRLCKRRAMCVCVCVLHTFKKNSSCPPLPSVCLYKGQTNTVQRVS